MGHPAPPTTTIAQYVRDIGAIGIYMDTDTPWCPDPTVDVTRHVHDDRVACVQVWAAARVTCPGCHQDLPDPREPATRIDRLEATGSHDHQHGCGTWNTPIEEIIWARDLPDDDPATLAAAIDEAVDRVRDASRDSILRSEGDLAADRLESTLGVTVTSSTRFAGWGAGLYLDSRLFTSRWSEDHPHLIDEWEAAIAQY